MLSYLFPFPKALAEFFVNQSIKENILTNQRWKKENFSFQEESGHMQLEGYNCGFWIAGGV